MKTVTENAQSIDQVIEGVTAEEIQDDNGSRTASLPALSTPEEEKAVYANSRMFSIE